MKNLNSLKILLCCLGWCAAIHADVVLDSHHDDDHYHYVTSPSLAIGQPAVATLHATAVNNIFAQTPAFNTAGNVPIEVRYLPEITVFVPPAVAANVNTEAEFDIVTATAVDDSPVISLWYVDLLSTCGSTENSPGIAGCAGGSVNIVESSIAMSNSGPELLAHEFGHNLGLGHTPIEQAPANLMDPTLNNNTTLNAAQATAMLNDAKIQTDGTTRFIQVRPIIVAAAVPEPSAAACLFTISILLIGRRKIGGDR